MTVAEMDNVTSLVEAMATSNKTLKTPEFPKYIVVTSTLFYVFIFLLGILGNVLVIMVVCMNRSMRTSVNIYLINLCVADLLVLTVCMPTALADVYARDVWYFGSVMCRLVPFLENVVAHASVLTLVAIGIERYRVICRPLRGIRDDFIKGAKVVPLIWIICALTNIPWLYIAVYRDSRHLDSTPIKVCRIPMVEHWQKMYATMQFVVFFVTPFLVLLVLYCIICNILYSTHDEKGINGLNNSQHTCYNRRRVRLQVINIIICLVLLFFIFHLPYRIVSMWFTYAERQKIHSLGIERYYNLLYSVRILFYLNHAMNPIIYNFVSTKFRTALRVAFTRREQRGSLMSSKSNRRGNYNTPFTKPKQSQVLLMDKDVDNGHHNREHNLNHQNCRTSSSSSSSTRQKMNEFYPMYSHIIEKQSDAQ